jgi:hypothetical protein
MGANGFTVTLSAETAELAKSRAKSLGFADVAEYLARLVEEEAIDDTREYSAPEHLTVRTREQLERLIEEGRKTPARPMTSADWDQMRHRFRERHAHRAG